MRLSQIWRVVFVAGMPGEAIARELPLRVRVANANFGWGGASDGWYDFQALAEDRNLLYLFRVIP
jgi:hypothetical protein